MRRKILAVFPLLSAVAIFLGLWIANRITIPSWRLELNKYISAKTSPPTALLSVERTVQANRPWQFRADMSGASYGGCYYFSASYCYRSDQLPPSRPIHIGSTQPMPFLPDNIWCALVQSNSGENENRWVVYITRYQDLYNADWIIHESSRSLLDPRLADDLATIGCSALLNPSR
jgi:hypothetical protein